MYNKVCVVVFIFVLLFSVGVITHRVMNEDDMWLQIAPDTPDFVVVEHGDSYWLYAKRYYPKEDPRKISHILATINNTPAGKLVPGDVIELAKPETLTKAQLKGY